MRKLFFVLAILADFLFGNPVLGQINVVHIDRNAVPGGEDGFFYALPRTVIKIDVTIDKIENFKGPYAGFAMRYLGLKNVVLENSVEYRIAGIRVTTAAQPDPDQYYFVELGGKLSKNEKAGLLALSQSGIFMGTMPPGGDSVIREEKVIDRGEPSLISEQDVFPEVFKYSADISVFEKVDTIIRKVSIDTMTLERQYLKRTMVEKSPEQKAKEAADFISKIKDNRFNLISGYQEVNYNKETLEYMDSQLKILEKEYMKLFTGISIHKTEVFSFIYTPNPNQVNTEVPIFKFLKTRGAMELDEPGGKVVTIRVKRSGTTSSLSDYLGKRENGNAARGFYYRIPELARITVKVDESLQEETQCLVSQLGVVSYLPVGKWKVRFYEETGGIRNMVME
jgi:hypothetical protein